MLVVSIAFRVCGILMMELVMNLTICEPFSWRHLMTNMLLNTLLCLLYVTNSTMIVNTLEQSTTLEISIQMKCIITACWPVMTQTH